MGSIGISTACFYPMYLEKALERITRFDVPVCEIFFNCFSELEKPFVKQLKAIADAGGVKVSSVHPFLSGLETFLFFSPYDRRTDDGIDIYKRHFQAAEMLGANIFVLHGSQKTSAFCGMERYTERYLRIQQAAREFGVTLTHENVSRTVSCSPEFISSFQQAMEGKARFTFDLKQCIRAGEQPTAMLKAMGKDIRNVHINDFDLTKNECRLPFDGQCDMVGLVEGLKSYGYDGNYIIEVYSDNYKCDGDFFHSIERLKKII